MHGHLTFNVNSILGFICLQRVIYIITTLCFETFTSPQDLKFKLQLPLVTSCLVTQQKLTRNIGLCYLPNIALCENLAKRINKKQS